MKQIWQTEELDRKWNLSAEEKKLLDGMVAVNCLGGAILLKYFELEGRFPENFQMVPRITIQYLANKLNISASVLESYNFKGVQLNGNV